MAYKNNYKASKKSGRYNGRKSKYSKLERAAFQMGVQDSIVESININKNTRVYDSYKAGLNANKIGKDAKKPLM